MPALSAPPEEIERLLRAGCSDLEVFQRTGVARTTVARYRKRLGLAGFKAREDSPACCNGHPYPENAVRGADGWLRCRECRRIRDRGRYQPIPRKPSQADPQVRVCYYVPVEPDPIAVERAVAGDPPERLSPRERAAAVRELDRWGLSAAQIAERVRCSQRNVHYLRRTFRRAA